MILVTVGGSGPKDKKMRHDPTTSADRSFPYFTVLGVLRPWASATPFVRLDKPAAHAEDFGANAPRIADRSQTIVTSGGCSRTHHIELFVVS
jgi:hypothetical protein